MSVSLPESVRACVSERKNEREKVSVLKTNSRHAIAATERESELIRQSSKATCLYFSGVDKRAYLRAT